MNVGKFFHRLLPAVLFVGIGMATFAQNVDRCGTDAMQQYHINHNPGLEQQLLQLRQQIVHDMQHTPTNKQLQVITIPVVVHVIHNGEAVGTGTNISDAQVLSQIEVLNRDYRRLNADTSSTPAPFKPLAADFELEFKLAVRAPDGSLTDGIDRIDGGQPFWTMSGLDNNLKPTTVWDRDQYLNIWTVNLGGPDAGTLGYAIKPGNSADIDGVVIGYRFFGTTGNLQTPFDGGRTCTHEVGHWLGLDHTWGLAAPGVSNCNDDDGIADTPVQSKANYNCPTFPSISCSNGPNGDMFMNYMDYVNDNCMNMFTQGQKDYIWTVLNGIRNSITTSTAATRFQYDAAVFEVLLPTDTVCDSIFRPLITIRNEGSETITRVLVSYIYDQGTFNQTQWTGSLAPGASTNFSLPQTTQSPGNHELVVYVSDPNNQTDENSGNDDKTVNFYVEANAVQSIAMPYTQDFESPVFPPADWITIDTDFDGTTWELDPNVGQGSSSFSASVAMFNYSVNADAGTVDRMITEAFNVPDSQEIVMSFDLAAAPVDASSLDVLKVFFSVDCGRNWTLAYSRSGSGIYTSAEEVNLFFPNSNQWRKHTVPVLGLSGQDNVSFMFESAYGGGNNMYLDNINIYSWAVGIEETAQILDWQLMPNPASTQVQVLAELEQTGVYGIAIYDLTGRQVQQYDVMVQDKQMRQTMDVSGLQNGIYLVRISHQGQSFTKKLIIGR